VEYKRAKDRAHDADFHDFLVVLFKNRLWIIDPAWQQFLPEYAKLITISPSYGGPDRPI